MASGFDMLGASEFADQVISIRVVDIDRQKLEEVLGGSSGAAASMALSLAGRAPKAALDLARPLIVDKAKSYGVTLEMSVSNQPTPNKRALSEFWPGLVAGGAVGFSMWGIVKLVSKLVGR